MAYAAFAPLYDTLMGDVNYKKRTDYILKLFKKFSTKPKLLLDLACGTGGFSNQFASRSVEVIGVDTSEEMLAVARENSALAQNDVLYLCQKAEALDLYGTVDGAICCMDSMNHITDKRKLKKAFERVALFLEKDKVFIFDCNTEYKHSEILGDNTFFIEEDGVCCVWQNRYNKKRRLTDISLDFFVKDGDDYRRSSETFCERAYSVAELTELLESVGFRLEAVFDDMSELPLRADSERAFFVARKM